MVDDDTGHLRVSDAERQQVVDRLSQACGDGLLTLDEFADQSGAAYAAITRAELDAVVRDLHLPVVAAPPMAPAAVAGPVSEPTDDAAPPKRRWVVAIMGGEDRRGKWRIGRRTGAFALMGGVDLDLRDAVLEGDEIEITAWAIMGGVTIIVPEGIPVECEGFILMGGRSNRIKDVPPVPGAPVIRVKGYGMWGGVDVRSKPPRKPGDAERDDPVGRALDRAAEHMERHHERFSERMDRHQERLDRASRRGEPLRMPRLEDMIPKPPMPPGPPGRRRPREPEAPAAPVSGLVTVVCTDIVGSTRYADTLGDQRWRGVLQAHNALIREQLAAHGGTEIKTSGDGFLVTFTSARRAVQFAVDVQDRLAEYRTGHPETPLEVRIGVHAGEVERDGNDVVGRNVSLACRLCDAAAPGEVLASSVVADLADSASDLEFGPPREHQLAGIERPVHARTASPPLSTAAVVLAAGGGTRFVGPTHKLLAPFGHHRVIDHSVARAVEAAIGPVYVVTGAITALSITSLSLTMVGNERWAEGIATSLAVGVEAARSDGHDAVVGLGDQPSVSAEAWRRVAAATATPMAVATYDGVRGNPVRLAASVWPDLPTTGDEGARTLLRSRGAEVTEVPCPGSAADVDTVEDLHRWS